MLTDANGEERKGIEVYGKPVIGKECIAATVPIVTMLSDYYYTVLALMLAGF